VTLLTGFLGAGKTTRLNATLSAGTSRVAVIENELGALGVDGALVANTHDDGVIELSNGCLCCSAEVDLISALEGLAHRRTERPFDRLIIETTGLADVGPVVALLRDEEDSLAEDFIFDGVVTIVDAAGFRKWAKSEDGAPPLAWASGFGGVVGAVGAAPQPGTPGTDVARQGNAAWVQPTFGPGREAARTVFWKQIAMADQLIISKADVAGEAAVQELLGRLAETNPLVEPMIERGKPGVLPPPLLGAGSCKPPVPFVPRVQVLPKRRRGEDHLAGIEAISLRPLQGRPLRGDLLRKLALELLEMGNRMTNDEGPGDIWRIKGFLLVENEGPMLLQGVGDQVSLEPWPQNLDQGQPFVVVIGENLKRDLLEKALDACASVNEQLRIEEVSG
jgi:G3E family GTPase